MPEAIDNVGPWSRLSTGRRIALPVINQHGHKVGETYRLPEEILCVEAYVDERGTTWTPPTAYAYAAACDALAKARGES